MLALVLNGDEDGDILRLNGEKVDDRGGGVFNLPGETKRLGQMLTRMSMLLTIEVRSNQLEKKNQRLIKLKISILTKLTTHYYSDIKYQYSSLINLTNVHFNWHQVWNDCKSKATVAEATLKTQPLRLCSTLATGDFQIIEMMWHIYENRLFFTLNRAMPKENMISLHYLGIYWKVWKLAERSAFFCNWWWFSSAAGETHKKT